MFLNENQNLKYNIRIGGSEGYNLPKYCRYARTQKLPKQKKSNYKVY